MHILITGASGFIGAYVVREAARRLHQVTVVSRNPESDDLTRFPGVSRLVWDLSDDIVPDLSGFNVDCIIHLAAVLGGEREEQERTTIGGTSRLLAAAKQAGIRKVVGISSIAVLDYPSLPPMSDVDETAPVATDYVGMGQYAAIKARQEELLRRYARDGAQQCIVLRPGLVYDESQLISAHAGVTRNAICLLVAHEGQVPTVEVNGLARAIVEAAEKELPNGAVLNLVDDNLPGQLDYIAGLRRRGLLPSGGITLSWRLAAGLAWLLRYGLSAIGKAYKLPEAMRAHALASRFKPYRFSNAKARELLGWRPGGHFY
jgi:nucleoside-diphosphate-sugar epimerase